jgi:hypothetical protein
MRTIEFIATLLSNHAEELASIAGSINKGGDGSK